MASKRRGGFRPPELRGTLGTLLRTTTGVVRDALERGAREGRARLDDVRAGRRRQDTLAELGELVLDLIRRGEIDLAELPEARDLVRQLDELDAEADTDGPAPPPPRPSLRRRFDDRPGRDDGTVSSGVAARPPRPDPRQPARPDPRQPPRPDPRQPPPRAAPSSSRAPTRPMKTWQPLPDDDEPAAAPPLPAAPRRQGGISFDDDDLADYMHPDDVPAKAAAKDPGDHDA
jgi:hypothetical protein